MHSHYEERPWTPRQVLPFLPGIHKGRLLNLCQKMCRLILHPLPSNLNTVKDRTPCLCFWYTEYRSDTQRISVWKQHSNHLIQHLHFTDEAIEGQSKQAPASLETRGGKPLLNVIYHGQRRGRSSCPILCTQWLLAAIQPELWLVVATKVTFNV